MTHAVRALALAALVALPGALSALPWDKDMVDQPSVKAQEKRVDEPKDTVPTQGREGTPKPQSLAELVMARAQAASIANPSPATAESLARLRPAFPSGDVGDLSVTAGNASSLNDGGAALVVTSEEFARAHGLMILARIDAYATGATDPRELFFAPVTAVNNLMKKEGTSIGSYDLIEANEAFASQALADGDALGWDWSRVNVNGGAIALGHPIGASGARVLVTLLHAMQSRGAARGLATLCLGGGDAVAMSVTRI